MATNKLSVEQQTMLDDAMPIMNKTYVLDDLDALGFWMFLLGLIVFIGTSAIEIRELYFTGNNFVFGDINAIFIHSLLLCSAVAFPAGYLLMKWVYNGGKGRY